MANKENFKRDSGGKKPQKSKKEKKMAKQAKKNA